jgi:hypothetical protein
MTLIVVFRQAFGGPDGINQVAKKASIPGPLATDRRGANLPYFGKQNVNQAYSPQEHKKRDISGFSWRVKVMGKGKGARKGHIFAQGTFNHIVGDLNDDILTMMSSP